MSLRGAKRRRNLLTERYYFVYMMTNYSNTVIYTGITNDVFRRALEHKNSVHENSFTARYYVNKLVYYEIFDNVEDAIRREKQIKAGSRAKKIKLIESLNPDWLDLINKPFIDYFVPLRRDS